MTDELELIEVADDAVVAEIAAEMSACPPPPTDEEIARRQLDNEIWELERRQREAERHAAEERHAQHQAHIAAEQAREQARREARERSDRMARQRADAELKSQVARQSAWQKNVERGIRQAEHERQRQQRLMDLDDLVAGFGRLVTPAPPAPRPPEPNYAPEEDDPASAALRNIGLDWWS
jgi:hypothetical protein